MKIAAIAGTLILFVALASPALASAPGCCECAECQGPTRCMDLADGAGCDDFCLGVGCELAAFNRGFACEVITPCELISDPRVERAPVLAGWGGVTAVGMLLAVGVLPLIRRRR